MSDSHVNDATETTTHRSFCKNGCTLYPIFTASAGYDTEKVVRWCPNCGSVRVDFDYDGRINAGTVKRPKYKKVNNE